MGGEHRETLEVVKFQRIRLEDRHISGWYDIRRLQGEVHLERVESRAVDFNLLEVSRVPDKLDKWVVVHDLCGVISLIDGMDDRGLDSLERSQVLAPVSEGQRGKGSAAQCHGGVQDEGGHEREEGAQLCQKLIYS